MRFDVVYRHCLRPATDLDHEILPTRHSYAVRATVGGDEARRGGRRLHVHESRRLESSCARLRRRLRPIRAVRHTGYVGPQLLYKP
jgi:hypothetical protein